MISVDLLRRTLLAALASASLVLTGVATATPAASAPLPNSKPDAGALAAHLLDQPLAWEPCTWETLPAEQRPFVAAFLDMVPGVACATVTVPRDWHHPTDGHTIELRITRTGTAHPSARQGIIMTNPGGPGAAGTFIAPLMAMAVPTVSAEFDFWGMDPRGVGESTRLTCTADTPPTTTAEAVAGCLDEELTPYITTEQTAHDLDFVRALAGEETLNYLGTSYGTWLGSWYQRLFPHRSGRFVFDSAVDLSRTTLQDTWDLQPPSRDRQFQESLLPYVARNAAAFGASSDDPLVLRRQWEEAGGLGGPLAEQVLGVVLDALYSNSRYPVAARVIVAYIALGGDAALGDTDPAVAFDALLREAAVDPAEVADPVSYDMAFDAVRCQDGPWKHSMGYWDAWLRDLDRKAPFIAPITNVPACAWWPHVTQMPRKLSPKQAPSTLIVQSELDAAAPYEGGLRSARLLHNTALVSIDNEGSHGVYPYGTTCVDDKVETYLLTSQLPEPYTVCQARPLPLEDQTYEVGGTIGPKDTIRIKMRTDEVKQANRMLRELTNESTR